MPTYRLLTKVLPDLPPLSEGIAEIIKCNKSDTERLVSLIETIRAFRVIEQKDPSRPLLRGRTSGRNVVLSCSGDIIVHNMDAKAFIGRVNPDIVMFNHIQYDESLKSQDLRAIIRHFEAGYIFGTEFIEICELENANTDEDQSMDSEINFFGNVILSRFTLKDAFRVQLDEKIDVAFSHKNAQRVIAGYHSAVGAKLEVDDKTVWVVNSHLSGGSTEKRQSQVKKLIDAIENHIGSDPVIIGCDLSTEKLSLNSDISSQICSEPIKHGPLLAEFRSAGFEWRDANTDEATDCTSEKDILSEETRQKWFFVRGLKCSDAATLPIQNSEGAFLSAQNAIRISIQPTLKRFTPRRHPLLSGQ